LLAFLNFQDAIKEHKINQNAKASVSKSVNNKLDKKEKIFKFIKLVQPKYTDSYISKIVEAIFKYGKKYNVEPYVIASTAYVESEFDMNSKPCIGMMQLLRSTARYYDPQRQYNPYQLDGNIAIGTIELSHHLKRYTPRSDGPDRSSYRGMYRSYNGSTHKNQYAIKALLVQYRLEHLNIDSIKQRLKKGPIWR
jgi:soluble lytic murein transglycosylase-like protein